MQSLKKLHKALKQSQALQNVTRLLDKVTQSQPQPTPQQFSQCADHARLCQQIEKLKLSEIEEAFNEMPPLPEITAIIIKAGKSYTLAFLMIPEGKYFGWHDHADMNGISRIIAGAMKIRSLNPQHLTPFSQNMFLYPVERIREQMLTPTTQKLSIIYPDSYNIHEIMGIKQSCFLDLLMPEYPDNSCHYFQTCDEPIVQGELEDKIKIRRLEEGAEQIIGLEKLAKLIKDREKQKDLDSGNKGLFKNNIIIQNNVPDQNSNTATNPKNIVNNIIVNSAPVQPIYNPAHNNNPNSNNYNNCNNNHNNCSKSSHK